MLKSSKSKGTAKAGGDARLSTGQNRFALVFASKTGLDINVINAWLLAEESGPAAINRERSGNNDWLNIGYTDSGTFGASNAVWKSPDSAASASANWLRGTSMPGFGKASTGIRNILKSAGQGPQAQISAIQHSGWASSGYPDLPGLYKGGVAQPALDPSAGGSGASGGGSVGDVGTLISTLLDPTQFAKLLVDVIALLFRWIVQAFYKWVFQPPWHATQKAVDYYWTNDMSDGNRALVTLGFWSFGYAILHVDVEGGIDPFAKPSRTALGRTLGTLKSAVKRPALTSPKRVKGATSKKPTPTESRAPVDKMRTLSATRRRSVTVTERESSGDRGRQSESRTGARVGKGLRPEARNATRNGNARESEIAVANEDTKATAKRHSRVDSQGRRRRGA